MESVNTLLKVVRGELLKVIDNIDSGNSRMDEEDAMNLIASIQHFSHVNQYMTKYEACLFLNKISRSKFDSLVVEGEIPHGVKLYAGDNTLFWKETDLMNYKERMKKRSQVKGFKIK